MTTFDLAQVDELLTTTKAVRKRLDLERPVEPEVISDCIRLATYAPSASNTQLWRWVVVTDQDKREQVAAYYREAFEAAMGSAAQSDDAGAAATYQADPAMQKIMTSSVYLIEHLHEVPVLVIPCYLERPKPEGGNIALTSMYGSILQATWSFQLALRSRGLGSVWTTMHLFREREVGELLGIPEEATQVALLPVAYTIGTDFKPSPRLPVEDVTYWNGWQAHAQA